MTALINAMRTLTDPAETGAVCIALPQDVEGESFVYPDYFFKKRVHKISRPRADKDEILDVAQVINKSKKPIVVVGGGVKYSEAGAEVEKFCADFNIPFSETQAGKSACKSSNKYCLGGIGVTGTSASNKIAKQADCVISIGSRMSDFTTASKHLFRKAGVKFVSLNNNRYHAYKLDATFAVGDAKENLKALSSELKRLKYKSAYKTEIKDACAGWEKEMKRLSSLHYTGKNFKPNIEARDPRTVNEFVKKTKGMVTQTGALAILRQVMNKDDILITAGGSLPSCLQRM